MLELALWAGIQLSTIDLGSVAHEWDDTKALYAQKSRSRLLLQIVLLFYASEVQAMDTAIDCVFELSVSRRCTYRIYMTDS